MSAEDQQRLRAVVHGYVQGVSFRYATLRAANELGLTGWVRNVHDGTVEVLAEGPRDRLVALEDYLHRGPPSARVTSVDAHWAPATGAFDRFIIGDSA